MPSAKSSLKAHFISPSSKAQIFFHQLHYLQLLIILLNRGQGNAVSKKITRTNNASSLSTKIQSLTTKKITGSNNTSSLSEDNTKDELKLKHNNFFSMERHSCFKKLDAIIQDIKILSFEIDELLMRFKEPLKRNSSFFNENNKVHVIPLKCVK